jgi:membrane-bound lytic murein transglycosylase MltF
MVPRKDDLDGMVKRRLVRVLVVHNALLYFVDRGQQRGATYDLFRLFEEDLNRKQRTKDLPVKVVFLPVPRDRLVPTLIEGRGDIAAANLTVTPEREKLVDFSTPLATGVDEILVTGPAAAAVDSVLDLSGREVYVRASSSYAESLQRLGARFEKEGRAPVKVVPIDERLETEDILEMVQAGVVPMTVVDRHLADLWGQVLTGIQVHPQIVVHAGGEIAWAFRKNSPQLRQTLDAFARTHGRGTRLGNTILKRYLSDVAWIKNSTAEKELARFRAVMTLFRTYGERYDVDWLLLAAQGYQESGLDNDKRSSAGAVGIMQLLPTTARDANVGIPDVRSVENNIHAGAKYVRFLQDRYFDDPAIDRANRLLLAFAAYNAGPARVAGLRRKASQMGLDPNVWFGNVEVVAAREIGRETVQYVGNIYKYYVAYKLVTDRSRELQRLKSQTDKR